MQNREEQTHKIQENVYSLLLFESIRQVIRGQLCVTVVGDEFQYIKRALQRNMHVTNQEPIKTSRNQQL